MKKFSGFRKGVNLGGWLSQCDYSPERLDGFITESDFVKIASWGLDHVRLPVDYNVLELPDGYHYIDFAVDMCRKYGLNIIIDIHKTRGFSFYAGEKQNGLFDNAELQEYFYAMWEDLAERYGGDPNHIAFELLNEVTDESYIIEWNRIVKECIRRIRNHAPETPVLVGSYWNNSVSTVKALDPPYDENVVYNFHCYEPFTFTHQGAPWTELIADKEKRVTYAESGASEEYFEELFASAIDAAERNGTVLYCGEYGVIDRSAPEEALKWYKVINAVFEKHGIGRSAWSYKQMDFGLSDERMDGVRNELNKYL